MHTVYRRMPAAATLEVPSLIRKESYLALVEEFKAAGEPSILFPLKFPTDDFPALIARIQASAQGADIKHGFVAHETFWLVDPHGEVVGASNLRLTLTDSLRKIGGHIGFGIRPSARRLGYATLILAETLKIAKLRGIARALVTCNKTNLGSARTILKNGGVFEDEELLPGRTEITQRYWITT